MLALRQKPPKSVYTHPHNSLRDLWYQPKTSTVFPPLVWYYLTHTEAVYRPSLVEALRNRWKVLVSLNANARKTRVRPHREVAYLGDGDTYMAEELTIRAAMLGQVETEIRLMNIALTILLNEIVRPAGSR